MNTFAWLKRILLVLLASSLLVACSMTQIVSDTQDERESKLSGTIVFWQSYPDDYLQNELIIQYRQTFAEKIKQFTKLYPQVKIIVEFTEDRQLVEKLKKKVEKGLGPDIIYTESSNTNALINANLLLPIDKYSIDLLQFRPEAIIQVLYQGKLYGIPSSLNTQVLCYNKSKVEQIPTTLSELIVQARKGYSVGLISRFDDAFWGTGIFWWQTIRRAGTYYFRPRRWMG